MTDIDNRLSDAELDAIASLDVHLDDEASVLAADRDRAEDAAIERRRAGEEIEVELPEWATVDTLPEPPGRSEEARAFAAETERDSWAQFATELASRFIVDEAAEEEGIDPHLMSPNDIAGIVESLYDAWSGGTKVEVLDATPFVRGWASDRGQA